MTNFYNWDSDGAGHMWSVEDPEGAWVSRGDFMRLVAVLRAERARSSHWHNCHEAHPICEYLRTHTNPSAGGNKRRRTLFETQMWGDDEVPQRVHALDCPCRVCRPPFPSSPQKGVDHE